MKNSLYFKVVLMFSVCCLIKSIEHDSVHSYFESNKKNTKNVLSYGL